jgi:hypothetical protein
MNQLNLFIDELGSAEIKEKFSKHYILVGCLVKDFKREKLKIRADQIKFKYWGTTNIIFHSRDIGRKIGVFKIFRDDDVFRSFQKDLFNFLIRGAYQLFFITVDKEKAKNRNWNALKIYKETANVLIRNFILALLGQKCRGRIVIESATTQRDFIFHKTAGFYLSNGLKDIGISFKEVQDVLTEISFVTKKNLDIEEQIADLLAYGAKLKISGKKNLSKYEKMILKVMKAKLFQVHPLTGKKKKKLYSKIESFITLP